jgi:hypothetical protein
MSPPTPVAPSLQIYLAAPKGDTIRTITARDSSPLLPAPSSPPSTPHPSSPTRATGARRRT